MSEGASGGWNPASAEVEGFEDLKTSFRTGSLIRSISLREGGDSAN